MEYNDWFIIIGVCVCAHDVCLGVQAHGVSTDVRTALWNLSVMGSRN